MATVIVMPRLSPTMEEGVLAKWLKNEGDKIAPGDIIAEVETDKANMDFPLEDDGVLLKQLAGAGETVRLGAPVGILGEKGEDISSILAEISGGGKAGEGAKAAPAEGEAAPAEEAAADTENAAPAEEGAEDAASEAAEPAEDDTADEDDATVVKKAKAPAAAKTKAAPTAAGGKAKAAAADGAEKAKAAPAGGEKAKAAPAAAPAGGDKAKAAPAPAGGEKAKAAPAAAPAGGEKAKAAGAPAAQEAQAPAAKGGPVPPPPGAPVSEPRMVASPLARRMAGDAGLDIRNVAGSGPGGRVIKRDIAKALLEQIPAPPAALGSAAPAEASAAKAEAPAKAAAPKAAAAAAAAAPGAFPGDETVPLSMMRRAVAKRLTESKQTVPHFYLTSEASVDALWNFREDLNRASAAFNGEKVSVNDFILKALARALRVVPAANMSFGTDGVSAIRHQRVDISVAVAMEDGLITPVVRGADTKSLGALAKEVKELAARGRDKKLRPEEYTGGTFSLTNLGMFGIREFYAIVNPPESGILAVGQVEKRPVVVEIDGHDEVRIERRLTLTLSCDHRVIDGALGAKLLAEIVRGLTNPMLLVL